MVTTQTFNGAKTIPTLPQRIPFSRAALAREEPDVPDSVHRTTEDRALRQIAMCTRFRQQAGGHTSLSRLHLELLRLERGAMQHLPHLTYDERMEFIAGAARLRNVSPRQIEALLSQASDIMMLREMSRLPTIVEDYGEAEMKRLYRGAFRVPSQRARIADGAPPKMAPVAA